MKPRDLIAELEKLEKSNPDIEIRFGEDDRNTSTPSIVFVFGFSEDGYWDELYATQEQAARRLDSRKIRKPYRDFSEVTRVALIGADYVH